MAAKKASKKKGAKGGVKHQPGRGHDRKSAPAKKKRFALKADKKRTQHEEDARNAWEAWDRLPEEVKRLLGPSGEPEMPRPNDE